MSASDEDDVVRIPPLSSPPLPPSHTARAQVQSSDPEEQAEEARRPFPPRPAPPLPLPCLTCARACCVCRSAGGLLR